MGKNKKIKFLLHTIQRSIQKDDFARMTYFPGRSKKCVMHIDTCAAFHTQYMLWNITTSQMHCPSSNVPTS